VSDQIIYNWRCQDLIDRGLESGSTSSEQTELGPLAAGYESWNRVGRNEASH